MDITGYSELFRDHYGVADERNLVGFLVGDTLNPGSVIYSLNNARENARTIRDIIPREAWEQINNLYLKCKGNLQSGLSRRGRYDYLHWTILGVQTITGMLAGMITHDAGYGFLRMGRNLERADMTTRIIDVRSVNLLSGEVDGFVTLREYSMDERIEISDGLPDVSPRHAGAGAVPQCIEVSIPRSAFPALVLSCH